MSHAHVGIVIETLLGDENLRIRFALERMETIADLFARGVELTGDEIDLFCQTDARLWFLEDEVRREWRQWSDARTEVWHDWPTLDHTQSVIRETHMNRYIGLALLTAFLLGIHLRADEAIKISARPRVIPAPGSSLLKVTVERNQTNRALIWEVDGATYYRSSRMQLEGASAARSYVFMLRDLPGGRFDVRARVVRSDNTEVIGETRIIVVGRDGWTNNVRRPGRKRTHRVASHSGQPGADEHRTNRANKSCTPQRHHLCPTRGASHRAWCAKAIRFAKEKVMSRRIAALVILGISLGVGSAYAQESESGPVVEVTYMPAEAPTSRKKVMHPVSATTDSARR